MTSSTGDFVDITLPSTSTSRAKIVIRAATSSAIQDSTDAYFSIRTATGAFVNPSSATTVLIGSIVNLEWVSPQNSQFVDVELFDRDINQFRTTYGNVRDFVLNLPDRGRYAYLVPERWMPGTFIRLTFKDANGTTISTLNSPAIDIRYTLSTGRLTSFYRLFSPITFEHLLTTDANEYNVLSAPGGGWVGESNPPAPVDQILTGDYQIGGVNAVPFYRLYNSSSSSTIGPAAATNTSSFGNRRTLRPSILSDTSSPVRLAGAPPCTGWRTQSSRSTCGRLERMSTTCSPDRAVVGSGKVLRAISSAQQTIRSTLAAQPPFRPNPGSVDPWLRLSAPRRLAYSKRERWAPLVCSRT